MKTTPTETDQIAARLFAVAPGMRAWRTTGVGMMSDPGMVIEVDPATAPHGGIRTERGWSWLPVCAIDTDDDATKGVMLAQLRAEADAPRLHVVCGDPDPDGVAWWSIAWWNAPRRLPGRSAMSRTEGAALVAAKRALAEACR